MKTVQRYTLFLMLFISAGIYAQVTVSGTVTEQATGTPLPGVNVFVKGTTIGTTTDFDGGYEIETENGNTLVFSYIGFQPMEVVVNSSSLDIALIEDTQQLGEVVVIGYGTVTREDATGSVDVVTTKDFNKGAIISTDQLLNGKAAGVRITTAGGSPDSAPNIRIRGGASLNAQNNPLIVIDGVPIGTDNPSGVANPLTLVNPNDVESFSILKDASATAIYGSRASNGVIIITTKRGASGELKFNLTSDVTVSNVGEGLDMMTSEDYIRFIEEYHPDQVDKLGVPSGSVITDEPIFRSINGRDLYDTDWRDAIYRTAFTSNTNLSVSGSLFDKIPIRSSIGYTNSGGIVKTDDYERISGSVKLTPRLLDDNLKLDVNAKVIYADKNAIDTGGALGSSLTFDPTKPVFNSAPDNRFGGYYLNTDIDRNRLIQDGQSNPLAILKQRSRPERVVRFLGNIQFDYSMPFLPELKAVVNLGLDASRSKIRERFSDNAIATYRFDETNDDINSNFVFNPGTHFRENQHITNTTLDAYTQYSKLYENGFVSKFTIQGGYSYQNFKNDGNKDEFDYDTFDEDTDGTPATGLRFLIIDPSNLNNRFYNELNLQSFFGRTNIDILDRYLFTLSFRADASSLFSKENRWGYFPAAALAWKISSEPFMENSNFFNELKLRLGWGETGQQDITDTAGFYPSLPLFQIGDINSQYLPNSALYSALAFNPELTWEKTTTYNIGLDFNLFAGNIVTGAFDLYKRDTRDLLADVPVPPGQAFSSSFIDNVGKTESEGFELNLTLNAIQTENLTFSINSNVSYNNTEVTDLNDLALIPAGGGLRGTGVNLKRHAVGQQAGSAFVLKQVYDSAGNPIPNAFVDLNGDDIIDDDDRYFKQIAPNWTYGFGFNLNYKAFDLSSSFRGQVGGNVYNLNKLNLGFTESAAPVNNNSITNVLNFYNGAANPIFSDVNDNIQFSDYFLEDATFLRCDNIALGYTLNEIMENVTLRLYGAVTNPFIITDYTGQDPENFDGIDGNFYVRPTSYTFGINLDF